MLETTHSFCLLPLLLQTLLLQHRLQCQALLLLGLLLTMLRLAKTPLQINIVVTKWRRYCSVHVQGRINV